MFGLSSQCLLEDYEKTYYEVEEYASNVPRWCPGCGDHAILSSIQRVCHEAQLPPEKTVFVSGIGCSSRFPHYMGTYGFHGLHGRALPVASGVKIRRPDLHVFVNTGDGDCCSIGALHWLHAVRYNMDMVVMLHDNEIYGLTKAQASPTSPIGLRSNTSPRGAVLGPLNPLTTTLGMSNVSFVAQAADWIPGILHQILQKAFEHRGFSFVRILQRCPKYTSSLFECGVTDPSQVLMVTHDKGIQLDDTMAKIYKNTVKHHPLDIHGARDISSNSDVFPVGILYHNPDVPSYEELNKRTVVQTPELIRDVVTSGFESLVKESKKDDGKGPKKAKVDGATATALGIMAAGMEVCTMYPIDPATSIAHYLSDSFEKVGGIVHQAEDQISAIGFATGAAYAGKCSVTMTSGPGLALKMEFIGLLSMAEIPMVIIDVQRSGPSNGLSNKSEQGDLLSAMFGTPGDAPKVILAPSSPEDCFHTVITARKLADTFRMPVLILMDADLAKAKQEFEIPEFKDEWIAAPIDQSPIPKGLKPYEWDEKTGLSRRFIPGQQNGMHAVTGLAHDSSSKVAYDAWINQDACDKRSLKLVTLRKTLKPPKVYGDAEGDLLLVSWGSTKETVEESVDKARKDGLKVSSLHLKFLQPMAPGLKEIMQKFKKVMTVEVNFSDSLEDDVITEDSRRYSNLAWMLRSKYLLDIDCWSTVDSIQFKSKNIEKMIRDQIDAMK